MKVFVNILVFVLAMPVLILGQTKNNDTIIEYYKNGAIKLKKNYGSGLWIEYYENGNIKIEGNILKGLWTEFYKNGNIKSIAEIDDWKLSGQRYCFSIDGDTLVPRLIKPKLVSNNATIINNTDLKVYLLFDLQDSLNKSVKSWNFRVNLYSRIYVCQNDFLTIHIGEIINLKITPTETWFYEQIDTTCNEKIPYLYKNKNSFESSFGKIVVEYKEGCMDTGRNPFEISRNGKTLSFKDIGNLIFFEYDTDSDGKNELYVLNYFCCKERLEIYKIDDK